MLVDADEECEDGVGIVSAEWMEGTTAEAVVPIRALVESGEKGVED
jgi:hypothetical protein